MECLIAFMCHIRIKTQVCRHNFFWHMPPHWRKRSFMVWNSVLLPVVGHNFPHRSRLCPKFREIIAGEIMSGSPVTNK